MAKPQSLVGRILDGRLSAREALQIDYESKLRPSTRESSREFATRILKNAVALLCLACVAYGAGFMHGLWHNEHLRLITNEQNAHLKRQLEDCRLR